MSAIWWIRRDIRLINNPALRAALEARGAVFPLFILDPSLLRKPAEKRQAFLFAGLCSLAADLRARGSCLVIRQGRPQQVLVSFIQESGAGLICAEEDYSPYSRRRDIEVAANLPLQLVQGMTLHHPGSIHKEDGSPYKVFTPFSKAWKSLPLSEGFQAENIPNLPAVPAFDSVALPQVAFPGRFPAGEIEAQRRLQVFLDGPVYRYRMERDRMDLHGTTELSPYLRFGMLPLGQAIAKVREAARLAPDAESRRGCETWLNELIWREFYNYILYHFPGVLKGAFNPGLRAIPWRENPADLHSWKAGLTGYPVVDAAMRQL